MRAERLQEKRIVTQGFGRVKSYLVGLAPTAGMADGPTH